MKNSPDNADVDLSIQFHWGSVQFAASQIPLKSAPFTQFDNRRITENQGICNRHSVKFGVHFKAYHKFEQDQDTLNKSAIAEINQ